MTITFVTLQLRMANYPVKEASLKNEIGVKERKISLRETPKTQRLTERILVRQHSAAPLGWQR
jgi:hypothetical protein